MVYFDHILHTNLCQKYLTTGVYNGLLMDEGLLSIISVGCGQLVKMRITLEPLDIFGLNFADLFILKDFRNAPSA